MKRNPRKISWTVLYRRKHKKGSVEEVSKKRTRRNVKFQRAIQGATLENIMAKRNQKPEVRKAQREQAIRWVNCSGTHFVVGFAKPSSEILLS
jgi:large subunit ribosomal protein L24e